MRKKACVRCGKIIEYNEHCKCSQSRYFPKSQIKEKSDTTKKLQYKRWREKREKILKRDRRLCQRCLIKYQMMNFDKLEVHHIKSREHYPELMYEDSNLITVCHTCNNQLGTKDVLDFEWQPPKSADLVL